MNFKIICTISLLLIFFGASAQIDTAYFYQKPLFNFDYAKPVFNLNEEQSLNKNGFLRFSVLTGYREGVQPVQGMTNFGGFTDTLTQTRRVYMINLSIVDMITHGFVNPDHVKLEVKNPSKYQFRAKYGSKDIWLRKNGYCFEFMLPTGLITVPLLEEELSHVFHLKIGYENRRVNTLVLIRTSNVDKIKSSGLGTAEYDQSGFFHNLPLSRFNELIFDAGLPLLIDETGYTLPVDLDLKIKSWDDIAILRSSLKRYDLDVKQEIREVNMFVIKEINQ